jgi:PIN domain nuclease of toxin-antitoxin system
VKLLLDTHTFIWWDSDPGQLSATVPSVLSDPGNEVWQSVVSVWEMVIKSQLSKLSLRLPLVDIVSQQRANGLRILGVALEHVLAVEALPPIHKDPFDRMLAAQAIGEDAEFVTGDQIFAQYPVRILW